MPPFLALKAKPGLAIRRSDLCPSRRQSEGGVAAEEGAAEEGADLMVEERRSRILSKNSVDDFSD